MVKYKKIPFGVRMNYVIETRCCGAFLRDSGFVQQYAPVGQAKSYTFVLPLSLNVRNLIPPKDT